MVTVAIKQTFRVSWCLPEAQEHMKSSANGKYTMRGEITWFLVSYVTEKIIAGKGFFFFLHLFILFYLFIFFFLPFISLITCFEIIFSYINV